jgi:hypothetical protein
MRTKNKIIAFTILLLCFSCNQSAIQVADIEFVNTDTISYEIVDTDLLIGFPENMLLTDTHLIIQDGYGQDAFFHAVDRNSGLLKFEFGKRGNGPGEVLQIKWNPIYDREKGEIQTFDHERRRLCYYSSDGQFITSKNILETAGKYGLYILDFFDIGNYYLACGLNGILDENRFVVFNDSLELIHSFEKYPDIEYDFNSKKNKQIEIDLFNNIFCFKVTPNRQYAVFASYNFGLLEIYKLNGRPDKMVKIKTLLLTKLLKNGSYIRGFEDIYVTDNYVYALHNGKTVEENPYCAKSIKIFDFEGNPVSEYYVGIDMRCLAVDEDEKTIYAVAYNSDDGFFLIRISI